RDVGRLAVGGHYQPDRRDIALAHARWQELDLAGDFELPAVDDVDLARELGGDPQFLAVGRRGKTARTRTHHNVLEHVAALGVDHVDDVAHLRGHIDDLAVFTDE